MQGTTLALSAQFEQTRTDLIKKLYKEKWNATQSNKLSESADNIYTLPNALCEISQWERCLTRLRIGHSKLRVTWGKAVPPEFDNFSFKE